MRTSSQGSPTAKEYKLKYEEKKGIKGIWTFHQVNVSKFKHLTDEQLEEAFVNQYKDFRSGKSAFKFPFGLSAQKSKRYNLVMDGLIDTIIARMIGSYTGSQDLEARFLAIGTGNETPAMSQTALDKEYYRKAFTEVAQVSNAASFVTFFNRTTANGFTTDAVTDAGNTLTYFLVDPADAAQFEIGDLIRVTTTSQFNFTTITNIDIALNTLTVSPPLADIPLTGDQVVQAWAEAGVFGNTGASITENTGTMFNRVNDLNFVKDDQNVILIEVQFIFTAV
jgi:hypothetical protein